MEMAWKPRLKSGNSLRWKTSARARPSTMPASWKRNSQPKRRTSKQHLQERRKKMRYLMLVTATKDYEAGKPPDTGLVGAMGKLMGELINAGKLIETAG